MKYGYDCKCGWHLNRTGTRREYANAKVEHAKKCMDAANEIRLSRGLKPISGGVEPPFSVAD